MLYRTSGELKEFLRIPQLLAATTPSLLSPRYRALKAAGAVFVLGFGALNLFAALGLGDPGLPGLYSFRAATLGDGLLLPLLAYALVRSCDARGPSTRFQTVFATAGGALGGLAGAGVQVWALMDPDTRLDWTFPAPHSYNFPGWYHAIFLIGASGFFARRLALVLAQIRDESRDSPALAFRRIRSAGVLAVLIPAFTFLGLLEEDDLGPYPRLGLIVFLSLFAFAAVVCTALCWACRRPAVRWCVLATLGALLPAVMLCDLFLPGHAARVLAFAIATARPVTLDRLAVASLVSLVMASSEALILRALLWARQYQPYAVS